VKNSYKICIRTEDQLGDIFTKPFTITVTDVNETPVVQAATFGLAENSPNGTVVGTATYNDPDAGQTGTFAITAGNTDGAFAIHASSGQITVANSAALDLEVNPTFDLNVQVTDNGTPVLSGSNTITVNLTGQNDPPTNVGLSPASVLENQPVGTVVGALSTIDPDVGDTFTYSFCGGVDDGSFSISGSNLQTAAAFNFETKNSYSICVRSTDSGGLFFNKAITVTVTNANEAPSFTSTPVTTATQGTAYTYNVVTSDPDAGSTLAITAPVKPAWLTLTDNLNGTATLAGTPTNANVGANNVTLSVSDGIATAVNQVFTITVGDTNDPPVITQIDPAAVTMSEDSTPTPFSLTLNATDPDPGETLTWSISTAAEHGTATASGTGTSKSIGYVPAANHSGVDSFVVQVTDGHPGSLDTITVNVTITGANDTPTDIVLSNTSIDESQDVGTLVGFLSAVDPDVGDTFTYVFCGGADDASFQISGDNLRSTVVFDYEARSSYNICVRSTDSGGQSTPNKPFAITINNLIDSASFPDVAINNWAWKYVEGIYAAGITGGCSINPLMFCPRDNVTRAQMAVFLLRGMHSSAYVPPPATGTLFNDVPSSHWAARWIEQLAKEGITGGCGGGRYCPEEVVTRAQMAIFLLRAEHGPSYVPPNPSGTVFTDVPISYWAAAWIEQLSAEKVTSGCAVATTPDYCPENPVQRNQMAVFLVRIFDIPTP
jgi:VCBS repeat-containing protein